MSVMPGLGSRQRVEVATCRLQGMSKAGEAMLPSCVSAMCLRVCRAFVMQEAVQVVEVAVPGLRLPHISKVVAVGASPPRMGLGLIGGSKYSCLGARGEGL